jgi:hypothetical protein
LEEKILLCMKTTPISLHVPLSATVLQQPVKPLMQKKAQATKPRLKNFFEMAKEIETERKQKTPSKKLKESPLPCLIETALLEKSLIQKLSVSTTPCLTYEALGSTALVEALLEKISYQTEKGVEKTSIFFGDSCNNPSLRGSEVHITCYDTDPMKFHLDFFSSAQGVLVLSSEMGNLKDQLQKKFPEHFFCLSNPCLNTFSKKKSSSCFSRKIEGITKKSSF